MQKPQESLEQKTGASRKVWFNGEVMDESQAKVSLFTHALHYGTGCFEGIRAYQISETKGAIFRLEEHLERLFDSAHILGFEIPYTMDELKSACVRACQANQFLECYLRPIAFLGEGPLGLFPERRPIMDVAILAMKWGAYLGHKGLQEGVSLKISSYIRPHPNSAMTRGKISGQYVTGVLAKQEAKRLGFHEALLLDPEGYLAEGSGENLFMVKEGVVLTTPLTSILSGITRKSIISILNSEGVPCREMRFTRDDLICADEAFLTGTAAEVTPIQSVDHKNLKMTAPGPITKRVVDIFHSVVRQKAKPDYAKGWLHEFELG